MLMRIKKELYTLLKGLKYNVMDNPYDTNNQSFPCIRMSIQDSQREIYKNSYSNEAVFKIDIFSNYSGEKEVLEIEQEIFQTIQQLFDNEYIISIKQKGFRLLDDTSTGVMRKHGVLFYTIGYAGGVDDGSNDANK